MIKETNYTISVTPKLLRRIADEMEERMENAKLGDVVPNHTFHMWDGDGCFTTVKLQADQDAYHARKGNWV